MENKSRRSLKITSILTKRPAKFNKMLKYFKIKDLYSYKSFEFSRYLLNLIRLLTFQTIYLYLFINKYIDMGSDKNSHQSHDPSPKKAPSNHKS